MTEAKEEEDAEEEEVVVVVKETRRLVAHLNCTFESLQFSHNYVLHLPSSPRIILYPVQNIIPSRPCRRSVRCLPMEPMLVTLSHDGAKQELYSAHLPDQTTLEHSHAHQKHTLRRHVRTYMSIYLNTYLCIFVYSNESEAHSSHA